METILTSVKVVREIYDKFRIESVKNGMTFQRFVNYSLKKYHTDEEFQNEVLIQATGSLGV